MIAVVFFARPWMLFLAMSWGARARELQAPQKWDRRLWGFIWILALAVALSGIYNPHLVRWGT